MVLRLTHITTVSVDRRAIGQRAASLLADRIEQIPREDDIIDEITGQMKLF